MMMAAVLQHKSMALTLVPDECPALDDLRDEILEEVRRAYGSPFAIWFFLGVLTTIVIFILVKKG